MKYTQAISYPFIILATLVCATLTGAQTSPTGQSLERYKVSVAVDEVSVSFHASDAHGLPINDLKLNELSILDNGKPPREILNFHANTNLPIRAGILIDTSDSVERYLPRNRAISIEYGQQILKQQTDQAFLMSFNYVAEIVQPWTANPMDLTAAIQNYVFKKTHMGGTALLTAIYQACRMQLSKAGPAPTGNMLLLFTDGEDNTSRVDLGQAVDMCQQAHTAIYAFRVESPYGYSSGAKTLAELAGKTGGRVFHDDDSDAALYKNLLTIEADLRNQYELIYKPAAFKHDGAFHSISLRAPDRVDSITIRSGYYAPRP
jgi:Ca-activated chloride channel homolog